MNSISDMRGFDRDKEILQGFYGAIDALTLGAKRTSTNIGWCERPMSIPIPPSCLWALSFQGSKVQTFQACVGSLGVPLT